MKRSELKERIKQAMMGESMVDYNQDLDEAKKKKAKDSEEEITIDDITDETPAEDAPTEETDTTIDVTTDQVDPAVKAVQDALTQAQSAAQQLGDSKLTDQIGNTITFFTRAHIVKPQGNEASLEEIELYEMRRMKRIAGIIK
jgi:hypothetical protein